MRQGIFWIVILGFCTASYAVEKPLTDREKKATQAEDLGPETIDVSTYPDYQRVNYRLFIQKCSHCHTPARAINSPIVSADEWKRYVGLMHTLSRKVWLKPDDRRWIRDFLAYDSQVRKVQHREAFQKQQKAIHQRFDEVLRIRNR